MLQKTICEESMTKFTFTYGSGDWELSTIAETMQDALLVYDKVGLSRREISKIKQEPVDPRNYAEEVLE